MSENCEKLIKDIEETLFDRWIDKGEQFTETKKEFWRELLRKLYHSKALNKVELYKQIDYIKTGGISRAFELDRARNRKICNG